MSHGSKWQLSIIYTLITSTEHFKKHEYEKETKTKYRKTLHAVTPLYLITFKGLILPKPASVTGTSHMFIVTKKENGTVFSSTNHFHYLQSKRRHLHCIDSSKGNHLFS